MLTVRPGPEVRRAYLVLRGPLAMDRQEPLDLRARLVPKGLLGLLALKGQ